MKALIIEDELLSAKKLKNMLQELLPDIVVSETLQSVGESVEWFESNPMPDVVLMDIHLGDNLSFSIFDKVNITCPIIFTTAYDEYALKAFEVNSIDYLLKPIDKASLQRALDKLQRFTTITQIHDNSEIVKRLTESILRAGATYKSSLLVSVKDKFIPVRVRDIAYVYFDGKSAVAVKFDGSDNTLSGSLDDIMKQLDPHGFYRANRQFIVSRSAVKDITVWFGNRVVVNLSVAVPERIVVSRTNVQELKKWLTE